MAKSIPKFNKSKPKFDKDDVIRALLDSQDVADSAKNRVQGACFNTKKYALISKPKLNKLKRSLRKIGLDVFDI